MDVRLRHPLVLFFLLVLVTEWILVLALVPLSPMAVGLIALVPTPMALLVVALTGGKAALGRLLRQSLVWRASPKWYGLAIAIPTLVHLAAFILARLLDASPSFRPADLLLYVPATLVLAVGEEVGWQGFALPRLRAALSPLATALLFGLLHALFHLPMYLLPLPEELRQAAPFPLFVLMAAVFALYRVWLSEHTGGSVPLIIVYHAAINASVLLVSGVDPAILGWLLPLLWVVAAQPLLASRGLRERPKLGAEMMAS